MLKKTDVLREGYVKGLKKAQRIIKEMIEQSEEALPEDFDVLADNDKDAIYYAEWHNEHEIDSYERIVYGEDDGLTWATIYGIVWGKPLR